MTEITSPYTTLSNNKVEDVSLVYNRTTEVSNSKLTKAEKRAIRKNDVNEDSSNAKYSLVQEQGAIPNRVTSGSQNVSNENNEDINEERWEDEAKYFEMLKDNDSFLYNKIVDKIKYFTPAFHSITPEGFNARLSFLHQCTRQGLTFSASDRSDLRSAGNLSFGRPPICVLRIGDFYNTRIVITNIQIDYNETNWDMNQEGIGVQPMFAKITMQFNFLGGSDIEAPISRLQNAVSFNYYANQSIYDDRADIGVYDNGKAVIQGKPWKPIINNEIK